VRCSLRRIEEELDRNSHLVSPPTIARILKQQGYSLKVNAKQKEAGANHPERASQFDYIAEKKQEFMEAGQPVISIDTKKKELIGDFKNAGEVWCQQPEQVNAHDFPSASIGRAVPYGVYDISRNQGYVYVGMSADTPKFAVEVLSRWWREQGKGQYPEAKSLLVLADSGGSNGHRVRGWKQQLQKEMSDRLGLEVTVCHYPTGCSKWNPIEHRLFSQISRNWAGKPLRTIETILGYIRGTTTKAGLTVKAFLQDGHYLKGEKVSDVEMKRLDLERHRVCPVWNYTIKPRLTTVYGT
jgi:hypothetical protein